MNACDTFLDATEILPDIINCEHTLIIGDWNINKVSRTNFNFTKGRVTRKIVEELMTKHSTISNCLNLKEVTLDLILTTIDESNAQVIDNPLLIIIINVCNKNKKIDTM